MNQSELEANTSEYVNRGKTRASKKVAHNFLSPLRNAFGFVIFRIKNTCNDY